MKSLTIAILNFNSGDYLRRCLESIKNVEGEAEINVIAIDNNSSDQSFDLKDLKIKDVEFVQNEENLGFSKGYNKTLQKIKSEFVLLLNPDCLLQKGVIKKILEDFEEDKKTGAATCKIILPNGKTDLTAHRGFPTPWASLLYVLGNDSLYHLTNKMPDEIHEVDAIAGAFFMTKKSILEEVGYLDEDFFLYGEDIDLCLRIKKKGYKILYDPEVEITHYKGISTGVKKHSQDLTAADSKTRQRAMNAFYESMIIFYNKHYKKTYPFAINWLVYLGIYLRWSLAIIKKSV
ncbi:MAG TPA: glycosyltransferase family 2 protein [Patescibacteria group bacterium]|nr:glycosyltransferase family 2 protein [Patescibacteria group bacterium]